jgi:hypothetical protein
LGISDNSPELSKICSTLSDLDSSMIGSASVACLLVREGADPYCKGNVSRTPLEICSEELALHLIRYAATRSTFHGSLRTVPKPVQFDPCSKESLSNSTASPSGCIALTTASQTPNVTSSNLITVPVATAPSTADPMTTAPMTTVLVTTAPMTTMALPTPAETTTLISQTTTNSTSQRHSGNKDYSFKPGDVVRVIDDLALVFRLQQGHGGWCENIALALGQLGRVMLFTGNDRVMVKVSGDLWYLNPKLLIPAPGETPPDVPVVGHAKTVIFAATIGDDTTLREYLPKRPKWPEEEADDREALDYAVLGGYSACVRLLLDYVTDLTKLTATGLTLLNTACTHGWEEIIEILLEAGADPSLLDVSTCNTLQLCASLDRFRGCQFIVKKYPELLMVPRTDGYGPLHLATIRGNLSVARLIVEHEKCDIDAITGGVHTALHLADMG